MLIRLCVFLCGLRYVAGLVVRLEAGERECFMIEVTAGAAVSGNYELIKPNDKAKPLSVTVSSEDAEKALYANHGSPDGTFAFDVKDGGILDLCLANGKKGKSDGIARSVGFAIRVTSQHTVIENVDNAGSLNELLEVAEQLNEGLLTLTDHQSYMREREETHRKTLTTTKSRIFYWTCIETIVLVLLALWQIISVRHFFEIKRRI
mmetsp:Transcript_5979/g.8467  ORF Transcript_5979/g.8467 Transcript_5979/m.8467 type:complete len:206 (-) Transcript_5979:1423-2040(-)